jgi:hypothetical protein
MGDICASLINGRDLEAVCGLRSVRARVGGEAATTRVGYEAGRITGLPTNRFPTSFCFDLRLLLSSLQSNSFLVTYIRKC